MRKRTLGLALALCVVFGADATAQGAAGVAAEAAEYLQSALDVIERNALQRANVDWGRIRQEAYRRAAGAEQPVDAYDAIRFVLRELADGHSFLQLSDALDEQERRRNPDRTLAMRPRARAPSPFAQRMRAEGHAHKLGSRVVARIVIPAFSETGARVTAFADTVQSIVRDLAKHSPCGWIVDLRGNGGGNMWPMLAGIGPVLGEGNVGRFRARDGDITWFYRAGASGMISPRGERHEAARVSRSPVAPVSSPVAVLLDRGTASAGEALAIAFRGRRDTRSFGEATYGVPTANQTFTMPDGANIVLTVAFEADRNGVEYRTELVPDEPVAASAHPGNPAGDPIIARAMHWLSSRTACR